MSKKRIELALKKKGLVAEIDYVRNEPTPSGYASGWDISLSEESENKLYAIYGGYYEPDCRTVKEVLEWVDTLPDCSST